MNNDWQYRAPETLPPLSAPARRKWPVFLAGLAMIFPLLWALNQAGVGIRPVIKGARIVVVATGLL